jgi:hypothetical protein
MKSLIFAAALMLGGAAVAQDTTGTGTAGGTGTTETTGSAQGTMPTDTQGTTDSTGTTQGTMSTDTSTGSMQGNMQTGRRSGTARRGSSMGSGMAAGNGAPERDARGIAVISADAAPPPGYNQPAQTGPAGTIQPTAPVTSMGSAGNLPPCSRTVTDHCTQTYERGVRTPR